MTPAALTLSGLNGLSASSFVAALGEVFERAPWVAEAAAAARPHPTVAALHAAMMQAVRAAPPARQRAFIAGHPELGSRVKRAELTGHSQAEQGSLGLDRLSAEEFDRFSRLNAAYREKFGFPFIVCVRRHTRDSILREFERRLGHDGETEHERALAEIGLIARLRLVAKVDGPGLPQTNGRLTTHVLDLCAGRPAAGVRIALHEIGGSARGLLRETITNADGRTDAPLISGEPLRIGTYELTFQVGEYFHHGPGPILRDAVLRTAPQDEAGRERPHPEEARSAISKDGVAGAAFLDIVPIRFSIAEPEGHFHVPLLATPWSYTTYRGS
jgi:2-oxo-4-hydroxy-4-carboxy-5-ureidoimidazoline decarboxylase